MSNAVDLFVSAATHWRDNKGVGTALIPPPLEDKAMVLTVLQRLYSKNPTLQVLIVVNQFKERGELIDYLTHQGDEENNKGFQELIDSKHIKIFSINYVDKDDFNMRPFVSIWYHLEECTPNVVRVINSSKFRLVVINHLLNKIDDLTTLYSICPLLSDFKQNEIDSIRMSTPVKEMRIGVDINPDTEDGKLLKYYDEYITTTVNIFGNFDNINTARCGDSALGLSSTQVCYNIAYANGWNERLDMSSDLNLQIDAMYNPGNIRERASQVFEVIRNRRNLVSDYNAKLDEILKIVENNPDKRILIINKRAEFAAKVTDYLNMLSGKDVCGNYHDAVEPIPAQDIYGNPMYVKSGKNKGQRRMIAAKAQRSYNETRFNHGLIHCLSTNSAPDKSLNVPIDAVIITSPECEDIKSYIYRLSKVSYPLGELTLYTLYLKNTIEERKLIDKQPSETHTIVNDDKTNVKIKNNFNFVVVD